jgi:adenosylcobinamide-phosphate guanylyltransferase
MCGGEGRRLAATLDRAVEKPLYEVGGTPMVDRVLAALDGSGVDAVHAVVSPAAPATRDRLSGRVPLVETPGEGYVADLDAALRTVGAPALTVAADLPLLTADAVDAALEAAERQAPGTLTVCVPAALKRDLGVGVDTTFHTDDVDTTFHTDDVDTTFHTDDVDTTLTGPAAPDELDDLELAPTGLNVATAETDSHDTMYVTDDTRLAVNVNRQRDARIAEALL